MWKKPFHPAYPSKEEKKQFTCPRGHLKQRGPPEKTDGITILWIKSPKFTHKTFPLLALVTLMPKGFCWTSTLYCKLEAAGPLKGPTCSWGISNLCVLGSVIYACLKHKIHLKNKISNLEINASF